MFKFMVWNDTDGVPAAPEPFDTPDEAWGFIDRFRKRYATQGYYLTAQGERISPDDVEFLVVPL